MTEDQTWEARRLWALGRDTADIARLMGLPERLVANAIPEIRQSPLRPSEPAKETDQ
jgi:hypothetical protein